MKKIIFIILIFMSSSVFASELPENVYNANSLQIHMRKNFYYTEDIPIPGYVEYFQSPETLEFTKSGDCDDFAIYSNYYLNKMGYDSEIYLLFILDNKKYKGHAITVFLDNDTTYSIFSNQLLLKTLEIDKIKAIKDVYDGWQVILKANITKYGYLKVNEVFDNTIPIEFVNGLIKFEYYLERIVDKVFNYEDKQKNYK